MIKVKCIKTTSESGVDLKYTGIKVGEWYYTYDTRRLDKQAGSHLQYRIETKSGGYWVYCYLFETVEEHRNSVINDILFK